MKRKEINHLFFGVQYPVKSCPQCLDTSLTVYLGKKENIDVLGIECSSCGFVFEKRLLEVGGLVGLFDLWNSIS